MPLYCRVTFSDRPYAEALVIGDQQDEIMKKILDIDNIEKLWNSKLVENKILELLNVL